MLRRSLTTLSLVFIIFFNVSGGAFTLEGLVAGTGPGLALAILLVIPLVWSLPEILIIGELASMLPQEGGYYRWVRRAFGDFWAFQNRWYTWLYSLVDMAIYPALFNQYLAYFVPEMSQGTRWIVALAVIWGATGINLRGALPVGRVSVAIGTFVLGTFALVALATAVVGTYSLSVYGVAQRRRFVTLLLRATVAVAIGVVAGRDVWLRLGSVIESFLTNITVSPSDPTTLGVASGLLAVTALIAVVAAALRLTRAAR